MDVAYVAVALLVGVICVRLVLRRIRHREAKVVPLVLQRAPAPEAEALLRSLFEPGADFIGKDLAYITARAGPTTYFGSLDHGCDVAQWRAGTLLAEAWFQSGVCTEVEVRVRGK
jgi:hypothetical protein